MPESRQRPGHPYHKPADISSSQRVKGRTTWAILFGVLGFLIAWLATGINYKILIPSTVLGAVIGYVIGKAMEKKK
ncbi:MAG TPA: hypothetical protein VGI82_03310 [Chitinophagaceae bacterium]|jgi:hypothetical protein